MKEFCSLAGRCLPKYVIRTILLSSPSDFYQTCTFDVSDLLCSGCLLSCPSKVSGILERLLVPVISFILILPLNECTSPAAGCLIGRVARKHAPEVQFQIFLSGNSMNCTSNAFWTTARTSSLEKVKFSLKSCGGSACLTHKSKLKL